MNGDHEAIRLGAIDGANTMHLPHALRGHHHAIATPSVDSVMYPMRITSTTRRRQYSSGIVFRQERFVEWADY